MKYLGYARPDGGAILSLSREEFSALLAFQRIVTGNDGPVRRDSESACEIDMAPVFAAAAGAFVDLANTRDAVAQAEEGIAQ